MKPAVTASAQPRRRLSAAVRVRWMSRDRVRGSLSTVGTRSSNVYTTRRPARAAGRHTTIRPERGPILDSQPRTVLDRPARRLRRHPGLQRGGQRRAARAARSTPRCGPLRVRDDLRRRRQHGRHRAGRAARAQGAGHARDPADPPRRALRPERRGGDRRARRACAVDRDARRRRAERSRRHTEPARRDAGVGSRRSCAW